MKNYGDNYSIYLNQTMETRTNIIYIYIYMM